MASRCVLEIVATGQKSIRSHGSEVWFVKLSHADGKPIPLDELEWDEGWEKRQENGAILLCSHKNQPAKLNWKGEAEGPLTLSLVSHPWSGVAQVKWNGVRRLVDLHAAGGEKKFLLDPQNPEMFAPVKELDQRVYLSRPPSLLNFISPLKLINDLWQKRQLIWRFAIRDVQQRYRGSYLGAMWSFLTPLLMIAVYALVFGALMHRQFEGLEGIPGLAAAGQNVMLFPLILFAGLIVFNIFSDCVNKAPALITQNPNYVKKVLFPVEILPVSILVSNLIHALICLGLFLLGSILLLHRACFSWLLFPLVLLPVMMLGVGLGWLFASLGVFIRDINNAIGVAVSALFFLSAIFYPLSAFDGVAGQLIRLNPLAIVVEDARRTLIMGIAPDWPWWAGVTLFSALVMQAGYVWFMKTKRWFADVL